MKYFLSFSDMLIVYHLMTWNIIDDFYSILEKNILVPTDGSDGSLSFSPGSKIIVSNDDGLLLARIWSIIFSSLVIIIIRRWLELVVVAMINNKDFSFSERNLAKIELNSVANFLIFESRKAFS